MDLFIFTLTAHPDMRNITVRTANTSSGSTTSDVYVALVGDTGRFQEVAIAAPDIDRYAVYQRGFSIIDSRNQSRSLIFQHTVVIFMCLL